jgi:hypothetical protein
MWLLHNETPFAAERTWTRDENGVEYWLVAVKAAFEILPDGRQVPLEEQVPVSRAPVFAGDPATTELLEEADFNLDKSRTDVLVTGHAYAPERQPAAETTVRVKLEEIDKSVHVTGDRVFVDGPVSIRTTRPLPFLKLPMSWHRSYGGTDTQGRKPAWEAGNPVGVGFAVDPRHLVGRPAPNFEYAGARSRVPAGFGPIARHWMPRLGFAGTYGDEWKRDRDPLPPRDFDRRFYQCAPEDQQSRRPLVGYEHVRLGNLTPDGFLQFLLPRITFDIVTQFYRRPDRRQEAAIHTLLLEPDKRRFVIVWHSALACPYDEERLKGTTIRVRRRINVPASVSRTGVWVS